MKSSQNGKIILSVTDVVKSCPNRKFLTSQIQGSHMFFHALTFSGSRRSCLNTRQIGRQLKYLPRDPASVNAMIQTYVIVILGYFTLFQPNSHRKRC